VVGNVKEAFDVGGGRQWRNRGGWRRVVGGEEAGR